MQKILLAFTLLFITASSVIAQSNQLYVTNVIDASRFKDPVVNLKNANDRATHDADIARHKHHDVVVYRKGAPMSGIGYEVSYYQDENGTITNHQFMPVSNDIYDKAEYKWSKDTICVRLFNSTTKDGKSYKGYGWGATNGMVADNK